MATTAVKANLGSSSCACFDFGSPLSIDMAAAIVEGAVRVAPSEAVWARCAAAHARLQSCIAEARHVYGVTTGFGPLANRLVDPAQGVTLQQNLVYHLATGLGAPLSWAQARAVCLSRLSSILQGYSGASDMTINALLALLNSDLAPLVPERGTVGASGDLTPLAHIVLAFQGHGAFIDSDGVVIEGSQGLNALAIPPLDLGNRDGLALVNGTSAMTGLALINATNARRLADWAILCSVGLLEVLGGRSEAWSSVLADIRPHPGQRDVTARLNEALSQSQHATTGWLSARQLDQFETEPLPGQDAYTLRCVPQVVGAVLDALRWHDEVVSVELNAVSDNPIFPPDLPEFAVHGGNFMGQHVALVSDTLSTSLVVLAGLAERQIARLTDETLNRGLPAFLSQGAPGLNSGFMGAQVTATATLAEMRSKGPASIHSISTNGANQDVVSMGTVAARTACSQVTMCSEILAVLGLAVAQAMDIKSKSDHRRFSKGSEALRASIRGVSPTIERDRPLSGDIRNVADMFRSALPPDLATTSQVTSG